MAKVKNSGKTIENKEKKKAAASVMQGAMGGAINGVKRAQSKAQNNSKNTTASKNTTSAKNNTKTTQGSVTANNQPAQDVFQLKTSSFKGALNSQSGYTGSQLLKSNTNQNIFTNGYGINMPDYAKNVLGESYFLSPETEAMLKARTGNNAVFKPVSEVEGKLTPINKWVNPSTAGQKTVEKYEADPEYQKNAAKQNELDNQIIMDADATIMNGLNASAALTSGFTEYDEEKTQELKTQVNAANELLGKSSDNKKSMGTIKNRTYSDVINKEKVAVYSDMQHDLNLSEKIEKGKENETYKEIEAIIKDDSYNVLDALAKYGADIMGSYSAKDRNAQITDKDLEVLAYLIGDNQFKRAANYYLDIIEPAANRRAALAHNEKIKETFGGDNPQPWQQFLAGIATAPQSLQKTFASIAGVIQAGENKINNSYEPIDTSSPLYMGVQTNKQLKKIATNGLDETQTFFANLGMGLGESIMGLVTGKNVMPIIMGAETMGEATYDAAKAGVSTEEATLYGGTEGAIAGFTDKLIINNMFSLNKVASTVGQKGIKNFIKAGVKQGAIEGLGEMNEEALSIIADIAILRDKGEMQSYINEYIKANPNSTKVMQNMAVAGYVLKKLGLSGVGGFLSGEIMGYGANVTGNIQYNANVKNQTDNAYRQANMLDTLLHPKTSYTNSNNGFDRGSMYGNMPFNKANTLFSNDINQKASPTDEKLNRIYSGVFEFLKQHENNKIEDNTLPFNKESVMNMFRAMREGKPYYTYLQSSLPKVKGNMQLLNHIANADIKKQLYEEANKLYNTGSERGNVESYLRDFPLRQNLQSNNKPKNIKVGQQNKHIVGTKEYKQKVASYESIGEYGPSRAEISNAELENLAKLWAGKGVLTIDKNGKWRNEETITMNEVYVGTVVNNYNGKECKTCVFKIKYAKDGIHIIPDYMSKKGAKTRR